MEWIVRSEHSVYHGILMTTYLAQHWVSCISLNSTAPPNFKEKKKSEATEEGKMPKLRWHSARVDVKLLHLGLTNSPNC